MSYKNMQKHIGEADIIFNQQTDDEICKIEIVRVIGYKVVHEWFYNAIDPYKWEPWLSKSLTTFIGIYAADKTKRPEDLRHPATPHPVPRPAQHFWWQQWDSRDQGPSWTFNVCNKKKYKIKKLDGTPAILKQQTQTHQHATHTDDSDKEITVKQLKAERKHQRSRINVDPRPPPRQRNANGQRIADRQRFTDGQRTNTEQRPTSNVSNRAIR
ncbi:hypothetical protein EAG_03515 [Camponotus floridanus]|uniref:Uncharacterized protein n=1 Tax=Camponotus floridanus TaxID=104421 RepID=E2AQN7_CAMFO|nr:hypothetical protein EAG_03515 [Camponotus floridanus]